MSACTNHDPLVLFRKEKYPEKKTGANLEIVINIKSNLISGEVVSVHKYTPIRDLKDPAWK